MLELRAVVHGKVHGVGFRATTEQLAKKLGLTGRVKNSPNSTVEIIAQGEKETLEQFLKLLKKAFAIDKVDIHYVNPTTHYHEFSITN